MKTVFTSHSATPATPVKPFFNKSGESSFFASKKEADKPFFQLLTIQKDMAIGQPDDPYEQEADKIGRQVMNNFDRATGVQRKLSAVGLQTSLLQLMPVGPRVSRRVQLRQQVAQPKCPECEQEEKLAQPKALGIQFAGDGAVVSPAIESRIKSHSGGGRQMDTVTRSAMESSFGADFSNVRVHTGSSAVQMSQELNAHAFTVGSNIFFNRDRYQPHTREGAGLLAHELTHTVQQGAAVQNKRISRNPLLSSVLSRHSAAHLSVLNGSDLSRKEMTQLQEQMPEEEMMQQQSLLQTKGVDEVRKKDSGLSLRRCENNKSTFKKGEILGVNTKNKQGWIKGYVDGNIKSLPDFLKVEYIEQKFAQGALRDHFTIKEGPYEGKKGMLKTGYLEKKTWGGAASIVFDSSTNKVDYGAGKATAVMAQKPGSSDPLLTKNKSYNLMLPDYPHSGSYGDYSSVWFRIEGGPQGDEYFHRGNVSWGCISVQEDKWPTIYNHVINKRNGTKYVGTAKRI